MVSMFGRSTGYRRVVVAALVHRPCSSYGPATVTVIEKILDRHVIEAQGYLDARTFCRRQEGPQ